MFFMYNRISMNRRKMRERILVLDREGKRILKRVLYPKSMISGGLTEQWLTCGKSYCRCQQGGLHGPYYYLSVLAQGKPRTIYLGRGGREITLLKRYQEFQRGIARLNAINRELVELLWELAEDKIAVFAYKRRK